MPHRSIRIRIMLHLVIYVNLVYLKLILLPTFYDCMCSLNTTVSPMYGPLLFT